MCFPVVLQAYNRHDVLLYRSGSIPDSVVKEYYSNGINVVASHIIPTSHSHAIATIA